MASTRVTLSMMEPISSNIRAHMSYPCITATSLSLNRVSGSCTTRCCRGSIASSAADYWVKSAPAFWYATFQLHLIPQADIVIRNLEVAYDNGGDDGSD